MADIEETLKERAKRYGAFTEQAKIAQGIRRAMEAGGNWNSMSDDKREALSLIANKIGRILNGDAEYHDNWHDIGGYAKLVADVLEKNNVE